MNMPNSVLHATHDKQRGLTLIEILVVFAIVSILGVVSMPMYQTYAIRTKVSGDVPLMHPLQMILNEAFAVNDKWPESNAAAGAKEPKDYMGQYLLSVSVGTEPQDGTMTLTYNETELPVLRGTNTIVFYPNTEEGGVKWECDQGTMPDKYRPRECI